MKKRILTLALALCMLLSILPVTAMASSASEIKLDAATFFPAAHLKACRSPSMYWGGATAESQLTPVPNVTFRTVSVTPGAHMTKVSGEENQDLVKSAITPVVYTADAGYYFPDSYSVATVDGIMVRRDDDQQITVYGTPTDNVTISLLDASIKPASEKDVTEQDFIWAYDTQRSPAFPAANVNLRCYDFDYPVMSAKNNGVRFGTKQGKWQLTKVGTYAYCAGKNLGSSHLSGMINDVASKYTNLNKNAIVIYELTKVATAVIEEDQHVAYGVILAYGSSDEYAYAVFIGDSLNGGACYLLGTKELPDEFNVTTTTIATDYVDEDTHRISLNTTGTYTFTEAEEGYTPETKTVIVNSTGTGATGTLYVSLSGTNADKFTLDTDSIPSISKGGYNTFTVSPTSGLSAGSYTATVTVSGPDIVETQSFDVSFTVTEAIRKAITLSPSSIEFADTIVGHDVPDAQTVTITNTGNVATGALTVNLTGENKGDFIFSSGLSSTTIRSIQAGQTATFTVQPNANLRIGEHKATITVSGTDLTTQSVTVSFTVTAAPKPIIEITPTLLDFSTASIGYSPVTPKTFTVTNNGNADATGLSIALTEEGAKYYTLTYDNTSNVLAIGESLTVTVAPKNGLTEGAYWYSVEISGTNFDTQTVAARFQVFKPSLGFVETNITFYLKEGYTGTGSMTATLRNVGHGDAYITTFPGTSDKGYFSVSPSGSMTVAADESVKIDVTTAAGLTGLEAGEYNDQITLEGNFGTLTLPITIEVEAKPSDPVYTPTYAVTAASAEHGTVALSTKNAYAGSAVTVTVTPDEGYALSSLTAVTRSGASVALTDLGGGRYRFTMPASDVTVTASFAASEITARFVDVPVGSTFFDAVEWAAANGITTGTTPTTFSPANACTRGQIVTFLWRAYGSPEPKTTSSPFTDVASDSFCYKAVLWAVENGITVGTTDTTFSPNVPCTRAQAVTLLYRAVGSPAVSGTSGFPDVPAGAYCDAAVTWAVQNGVTTGMSDGRFAPQTTCNRGQIAAFLFRALSAQK